jgi:predicted Rossmann fold flavoprotein
LLFTHRGISGPVALQLSSYWKAGHEITVNLLPDINVNEILIHYKLSSARSLLNNLFSRHLPRNLVLELQELFWVKYKSSPIAEISNAVLSEIAISISAWKLKPSGTEGYRTAEVTLCGVDTNYISSKTMECNTQPRLFFVGEVLDVTGHLGGYNFQWAWSSGYVAGCNIKTI